jgi:hypothetical protein
VGTNGVSKLDDALYLRRHFDSHKPAESYDHRGHIYAAQAKGLHW